MSKKGCYFSENSMHPQCHALWDRMEKAAARIVKLEDQIRDDGIHNGTEMGAIYTKLEKAEAERDRQAADCAAKDAALKEIADRKTYSDMPTFSSDFDKLEHAVGLARQALSDNPGAALLAERGELRAALKPFAEAGKDLDEHDGEDRQDAWESPAAMSVTLGDFRKAGRVLDGQKEPDNG